MDNSPHVVRCPHFQLTTVRVDEGAGGPRYLTFRHCMLSGRLVHLAGEQHRQVTDSITIRGGPRRLAISGPDMQAVTQGNCTHDRCVRSCGPAYHTLLDQLRIDDPERDMELCEDTVTTPAI